MSRALSLLPRAALGLLSTAGLSAANAPAREPAGAPDAAASHEQGLPFIEFFNRRDYRGQAQIWTGLADARGLLYFGNYAQILVYDGVQWDRIAVPGAASVRALALDAHDCLWVGASGALGYIDTNVASAPTFVSLASRLPPAAGGPGDIVRVHVLGDSVYFQSTSWLFRWHNDAFTGWPLESGMGWQSMIVAGDLLVHHPRRGWWHVRGQKLEPFETSLPQIGPTQFALPLPGSRSLVGTRIAGLFIYDGQTIEPAPGDAALVRQKFLFNGTLLSGGRFAFATLAGGAVVLRPDFSLQALLNEDSGLPGPGVNQIFPDTNGGLWLCLPDGLARVGDDFACTWFRPPSPLGRIDVASLARWHGRLYLGMLPALERLEPAAPGGGVARWAVVQEIGSQINALLEAGDSLLIGTDDGCFAWSESQPRQRVAAGRNVAALLSSNAQPGRFFIAHRNGIDVLRHDDTGWHAEGSLPGVTDAIDSLVEAPGDGTLWAGARREGVWRIAFGAAQKLPSPPGHVQVALARGQPIFLTTRGLQRFDAAQNRFAPEPTFGARFADGSTEVRALAEDSHGGVWIAPRRAIDASPADEIPLGRADRNGTWHPLVLPDLARIGDILSLHLDHEAGREILWAAGASGLLRVDLAALRVPPAGTTLLREATAGDRDTSLFRAGGAAEIAYAQNTVRFRVAAPAFAGIPGTRFETELTGADPPARRLNASAEREFANLAEGRYRFRARALSGDGRWTTPGELAFVVLPPWWRTVWARALWLTLGAGGIFGIVTLRTRVLRRRTTLLETTVADRTRELHARNEELARLHRLELDEKISARLAEEKTRLEMLRYQLNPHFLFNTLNSLYSLVEEHPTAGHMVLRLSEFCRLTLTRGADHAQTLGDELHMLTAYLDIEKVRWGDSLRFTIDVESVARATLIPPFLLLPLVENAIKHGGQTSPDILQLHVAARIATDGALEIEIANTGQWLVPGTSPAPSMHIGLENLRERLARSYPGAHAFEHESNDGWVRVRLRLKQP